MIVLLAASGCTVGDVGSTQHPTDPDAPAAVPDGGVTDAPGALPDAVTAGTAFGECRDKVTTGLDNGHHNAGQNCQNGCHNHGFTLSGTVYTSVAGTTPAAGVTIEVKDAAGLTFDMLSATNGNFSTTRPVTFPVQVIATSCPTTTPMSATVVANGGGCNKTGCHTPGAGQGAIHVP